MTFAFGVVFVFNTGGVIETLEALAVFAWKINEEKKIVIKSNPYHAVMTGENILSGRACGHRLFKASKLLIIPGFLVCI